MANRLQMEATAIRPAPFFSERRLQDWLGRDWKVALPFVLPMVVIMVGLILWPFINAILMSTTSLNFITGKTVQVGLKNYERLLSSSDYILSMKNTITFTLWSLGIKMVTGMTIALILNSKLPFRTVLTGIMLLPWIVPEIVTALAWKSIYDPIFGGLNPILLGTGIISQPQGWLSDPNLAMPSVIAVNVWKGIPFYVLLLLAGLKAIDHEQLEAAEVDGANIVQRFRHVTLPGLRYVIIVVLLLVVHLDVQPVRPHLPDDRRRPGRRHQALFDPRLREGHRLAAIRAGHGDRLLRRAADGGADLALGEVHAQGRSPRLDQPPAQSCRPLPRPRRRRLQLAHRPVLPALRARLRGPGKARRRVPPRVHQQIGGRAAAQGGRATAHGARRAPAHPAAVHALRALPVLLGDRHLVQNHAADQRARIDLLAGTGDAGAVPQPLDRDAVPHMAAQLGDRGDVQHRHLGGLRGARRLRAVAAEVHRRGAAHHLPDDHLPAAADAPVHPALPDADRPRPDQQLRRADLHLPDLPAALRDLGDDRLLPLDSRSSSRRRR